MPLPDEQREIADVFGSPDRKESNHTRKRRALEDLFRALLHQLMTAQIRVHDLDAEGILAQAVRENVIRDVASYDSLLSTHRTHQADFPTRSPRIHRMQRPVFLDVPYSWTRR